MEAQAALLYLHSSQNTAHMLLMMESTKLRRTLTPGIRGQTFSILKAQLVLDFPTQVRIHSTIKTICHNLKML